MNLSKLSGSKRTLKKNKTNNDRVEVVIREVCVFLERNLSKRNLSSIGIYLVFK